MLPISSLPLPPPAHRLTQNLTADLRTPSAEYWHKVVLRNNPSFQRRSRLVDPAAHFSFVSPLPLPFPYRIRPPEDVTDTNAFIENWLSEKEALDPAPSAVPSELTKYSSSERYHPRELLAFSEKCRQDCVPNLDAGDVNQFLGTPALAPIEETTPYQSTDDKAKSAREELLDVLSAHSVLASIHENEPEKSFAPWSLRYSGHQFGQWAGQLGDGRAISILETPHPEHPETIYELQLKGAGRTPYSRSADGLAVTRSSIREFLCAEAMNAFGIPTSRSLALATLPSLPVDREEIEQAAIVTRVAPSFIRVGSFEALNPPEQLIFLFGGGPQKADWEAMRILGEWVSTRVLQLGIEAGKPWGKELVLDSGRRNAKMVAGWQAYGFMHGVINTDNISIMGLTIDYGPYAFMDIYEANHICNHDDHEGRYAFKFQPTMIMFALRCLLNSLAPLIGAEVELGRAVGAGWASEASSEKLEEWKAEGLKLKEELEVEIMSVHEKEYWRLMRKRFALRKEKPEDENLVSKFLLLLEAHELDFHSSLRHLTTFKPSFLTSDSGSALEDFMNRLLPNDLTRTVSAKEQASKDFRAWLETYAVRIDEELDEWVGGYDAREKVAKMANPRFILRQWVLEEVIKKVEEDLESLDTARKVLGKVLEMATNPFEPWGREGEEGTDGEITEEEKEERRLCGIGERKMLGFQCSCSS